MKIPATLDVNPNEQSGQPLSKKQGGPFCRMRTWRSRNFCNCAVCTALGKNKEENSLGSALVEFIRTLQRQREGACPKAFHLRFNTPRDYEAKGQNICFSSLTSVRREYLEESRQTETKWPREGNPPIRDDGRPRPRPRPPAHEDPACIASSLPTRRSVGAPRPRPHPLPSYPSLSLSLSLSLPFFAVVVGLSPLKPRIDGRPRRRRATPRQECSARTSHSLARSLYDIRAVVALVPLVAQ